ncbi:unnamed protein product [Orchesella dallaii]|uniref:Host cell factor Kelch-repeats domain-containing protein n=1 Tax=Orchesella dallaii TaxID=48710 RepID=A0ABP1R3Z5_9HEXA
MSGVSELVRAAAAAAHVEVPSGNDNLNPKKNIPLIDISDEDSPSIPTDAPLMLRFGQTPPRHPSNDDITGSSTQKNKLVAWKKVEGVNSNTVAPSAREGHCALIHGPLMITFSGAVGLHRNSFGDLHTYNIITKEWSIPNVVGNRPPGLMHYGMDIYGDQIILFGGLKADGTFSSDLYELDTLGWEWSKLEPTPPPVVFSTDAPPCARCGHSFTTVDGKIYLFGGLRERSLSTNVIQPATLQDIFVLEYVHKQGWFWKIPTVNGPTPTARHDHSAVAYKVPSSAASKLVIFGGRGPRSIRFADVVILDIASSTWTYPLFGGPHPRGRSSHSATLLGTRMFVFGGWTEPLDSPTPVLEGIEDKDFIHMKTRGVPSSELYCLDLKKEVWVKLGGDGSEMDDCWPQPRACHSAAGRQSVIYIWSGATGCKDEEKGAVCHPELYQLEVERPVQFPGEVKASKSELYDNGVLTEWKAVEGADSYVLQICKCQNDNDAQVTYPEQLVPTPRRVPSSNHIPMTTPQYSYSTTPYYGYQYGNGLPNRFHGETMGASNSATYHMMQTPYVATGGLPFAQRHSQPIFYQAPKVPLPIYPSSCSLPSQFQQPLSGHPTISMELQDIQGGGQSNQPQFANSGVFNDAGTPVPYFYGGRGQGQAWRRMSHKRGRAACHPPIVPQLPPQPARMRPPIQVHDLSVLSQLADVASRQPSIGPGPLTSQATHQPPNPPALPGTTYNPFSLRSN